MGGLGCIIMVYRTTLFGVEGTRSETSYYMSSLKDVRAEEVFSQQLTLCQDTLRRDATTPVNALFFHPEGSVKTRRQGSR